MIGLTPVLFTCPHIVCFRDWRLLRIRLPAKRLMIPISDKEIRFKREGENDRGKGLSFGKQSMLNLPYQCSRKVSLNFVLLMSHFC